MNKVLAFTLQSYLCSLSFAMIISRIFLFLFIVTVPTSVFAQFSVGKYGGDFLSVGGGARPLAMGGAFTSLANDATAAYWNVAGLSRIESIEVLYMHSERFNGIVGYDYGTIAFPLKESNSAVAVTFVRQGVDGIKNTLGAWDAATNQPLPNPTDRFTEFSAYDLAMLFSYSKRISETLSWGTNFKVLNSKLGPFANAWGYSLDLALQSQKERSFWGISIMDVTTMLKFWQVNNSTLRELENFDDVVPEGRNERILPTVKIGFGRTFGGDSFSLTLATDTDIRFENLQTYYLNWGRMSFEPHFGTEIALLNSVYIRGGLTNLFIDDNDKITYTPTVGAGLRFKKIDIDYGLGSISGIASELGFTHRISLKVRLSDF